jgi:hypothetical protein
VFLALLLVVVLGSDIGRIWRVHDSRHQAAVRAARVATEAFLRQATVGGALVVDRSGTACHGIGELCVQSSLPPTAAISLLRAQLASAGVRLGSTSCGPDERGPFGASCGANGTRGDARLSVIAGAHPVELFWNYPTWVGIGVYNPDFVRPSVAPVATPPLRLLLPRQWRLSPCSHATRPACFGLAVTVHGSARTAIVRAALRLQRLGFGIESPFGRTLCGLAASTRQLRCLFSGEKFFSPGANEVFVTVLLIQSTPDVAIGHASIH